MYDILMSQTHSLFNPSSYLHESMLVKEKTADHAPKHRLISSADTAVGKLCRINLKAVPLSRAATWLLSRS